MIMTTMICNGNSCCNRQLWQMFLQYNAYVCKRKHYLEPACFLYYSKVQHCPRAYLEVWSSCKGTYWNFHPYVDSLFAICRSTALEVNWKLRLCLMSADPPRYVHWLHQHIGTLPWLTTASACEDEEYRTAHIFAVIEYLYLLKRIIIYLQS